MKNEVCSEESFELLISAKEFASNICDKCSLEDLFATAIVLIDDRPHASGRECLNALQQIAENRQLL